ncbi:MAG: D-alanyl-D-alanine carboxypeptidase [Actinobacteria bacterium]|nr:D-alanyl-D-alanine carboxypeptidase [Actinomycetota bacterium]
MPRRVLIAALCAVIVICTSPAAAAGWRHRITDAIGGRSVGVSVRLDGDLLYTHADRARRVPASNQKLLMTMALLGRKSTRYRIPTLATVVRGSVEDGVITGDLWLLGRGDPSVTAGGSFARSLPFEPTRLGELARRIKKAGIERVTGRVIGATSYFAHDWYATGWKPEFPAEQVPMPTALTFNGNRAGDFHYADPERRAAVGLTKRLRDLGIRVRRRGEQGPAPAALRTIAKVRSRTLATLLQHTNRHSSNFFAEVLGKRLGVEAYGRPGTIGKGAQAIAAFAALRHVKLVAYDSSGLSYSNRVSPRGMAKLLASVEDQEWIGALRKTLPTGDQGTLDDRLSNIRIRAKTGTLERISTLSGWVWLKKLDTWCAFSIMSRGMSKDVAADLEDRIVRILSNAARG